LRLAKTGSCLEPDHSHTLRGNAAMDAQQSPSAVTQSVTGCVTTRSVGTIKNHTVMLCLPRNATNTSSSSTFNPSSLALASLEPAPGPATTQWVFADTEPATLAPRLSSLSLAMSRLISSREPVSTQVWPASGRPSTTFFSLCQC